MNQYHINKLRLELNILKNKLTNFRVNGGLIAAVAIKDNENAMQDLKCSLSYFKAECDALHGAIDNAYKR